MKPEERRHLEGLGEARVRLIMNTSGGFSPPFGDSAREWLAERDDAERSRNEALQSQQMRLAKSASKAAWIAAYAAIGAVVVAVLGTIITVLAWIYPRH